ncbi:MAG TPA: hypothetical protein VH619_06555 [Verrucomicrobiae bacterium]|nr:hypothetical protein [Verrucomicrobiae bacterium]
MKLTPKDGHGVDGGFWYNTNGQYYSWQNGSRLLKADCYNRDELLDVIYRDTALLQKQLDAERDAVTAVATNLSQKL